MEQKNNRRFSRSETHITAAIDIDGREVARGQVRNVSLHGVFVEISAPLTLGAPCAIRLILDGGDNNLAIRAAGTVARLDPTGVAVDFDQVEYDSFEHLRRLVMFNSDDPNQVEQELVGTMDAVSPSSRLH